jgi:dihydroflavonol-4-reductase
MTFGERISEYVSAAFAGLWIQSFEHEDALVEIAQMCRQEAWRLAESQQQWDLVTINPSFVVGPGTTVHPHSESFRLVRQFGDGTMQMGLPDIGMGAVDVRDVAEAHLRAAFLPAAQGRYITSAHDSSIPAIAGTLLDKYGDRYPLPRRTLPKPLVWLLAPMVNKAMTRRMIARNAGKPWRADNSKIRRDLGIEFRPLKASMEDMFQQMIDAGFVPPRG